MVSPVQSHPPSEILRAAAVLGAGPLSGAAARQTPPSDHLSQAHALSRRLQSSRSSVLATLSILSTDFIVAHTQLRNLAASSDVCTVASTHASDTEVVASSATTATL